MRKSLVMLLVGMLANDLAYAQMIQLAKDDGLEISYKWEVGGNREQLLWIEARNENDVAVDFELIIFMKRGAEVVESTGLSSLCIGAGKSLKPKTSGLIFEVKTPKSEIDSILPGALNVVKADRKDCHL